MATYRALLSLKSSLDDPDSRLSALRLLNLSNNVFNRTFPPELSNLTNLRVLDLYNNNLTGVLPVSVATFHLLLIASMVAVCTANKDWRSTGTTVLVGAGVGVGALTMVHITSTRQTNPTRSLLAVRTALRF
ncbi:hypothetical protein ACLB2K_012907 [Fragaria x ananassa]